MPRFCHPLRWIQCLCWAMPWSSSKQTCIRCTSESFFKKRWGIKQGPHFFFVGPTRKKTWCKCVFVITKEENIQLKSLKKKKQKPFFAGRNGCRYHPKGGRNVSFFHGGCLGFSVETKIFFKRLIMGPRGNLSKKSCVFLLMKLSSFFLLVYFVLI